MQNDLDLKYETQTFEIIVKEIYDHQIRTISSSCCAFSIALSSLLFLTFSISAYI
jgi:hypothetical protein